MVSIVSDSSGDDKKVRLGRVVEYSRSSVSHIAAVRPSTITFESKNAVVLVHGGFRMEYKIKADPEERAPGLNLSNLIVSLKISRQTYKNNCL